MADSAELPYLLQMLDDESPVVRDALMRELGAYGPELEKEIARLDLKLSSEHWRQLATLRAGARREALAAAWSSWFDLPDIEQLERAQSLLSEFIEDRPRPGHLAQLLDELAADCRLRAATPDSYELANFLFEERGIRGEHADYYAPLNSSLCHVIESRRGNPISLCCVYKLVGARLGIHIDGLNFPGHFMTRAKLGNETVIVDCFSGARFMSLHSFREMAKRHADPDRFLIEPVPAKDIIRRVLNNLMHAYSITEDTESINALRRLVEALEESATAE